MEVMQGLKKGTGPHVHLLGQTHHRGLNRFTSDAGNLHVAPSLPDKEMADENVFGVGQIVAHLRLSKCKTLTEPLGTVGDGATNGVQARAEHLHMTVVKDALQKHVESRAVHHREKLEQRR